MAVKIVTGPPASNKPPPPFPEPSSVEYPFKISLGEHGEVWVSLPKPDRLTIIGDVLPQQFAAGFCPPAPSGYGKDVMAAVASGLVGKVIGAPKFINGTYWVVQVRTPEGGAVNFSIQNSKSEDAVHKLRIELNPVQLGSEGMLTLLDRLHSATSKTFKVGVFLSTARVSRVDVAVDLVGVRVSDLLLVAKSEGKRVHYFGQQGSLESTYVHRVFKDHDPDVIPADKIVARKGLGALIVRAYDKVEERKSVGKPPPFGPTPVTRVEVTRSRFGNKPFYVADLASLSDMLAGVRVGHIRSTKMTEEWSWLAYVHCRRGAGPEIAAEVLNLNPKERASFECAFDKVALVLWNHQTLWAKWPQAFEMYGLSHLSAAAKHLSSASHIGDFEAKLAKTNGHVAP